MVALKSAQSPQCIVLESSSVEIELVESDSVVVVESEVLLVVIPVVSAVEDDWVVEVDDEVLSVVVEATPVVVVEGRKNP